LFRLGGRESIPRHGGTFKRKADATDRRNWILGEMANGRVPDLRLLDVTYVTRTLRSAAETWRKSRVDVADGTATTHLVNIGRILPVLGDKEVSAIDVADVSSLVAALHEKGLARETIRKTKATLAMVLDFAGVTPNPARDRSVKLPREELEELTPPTAAHLEAVLRMLPRAYRLPTLVLDATGMRVGELEGMTWSEIDEPDNRWRVRRSVSKTSRPRWVPLGDFPHSSLAVFDAVMALVPREDRDTAAQVFAGFDADAYRTALARACKAAAVPAFSPHDLRHRRCTLWHLGGIPVALAAAWAGHSPQEHLKTYAHATLTDRRELDYEPLIRASHARTAHTSVIPGA
jgi:integrase